MIAIGQKWRHGVSGETAEVVGTGERTALIRWSTGEQESIRKEWLESAWVLVSETPTAPGDAAALIAAECDALKALLLAKNAAYGNAALEPLRIFSRADATEQLRVRLDDKLSRIARGSAAGEDALLGMLGYLVLLRVAERLGAAKEVA